MSSIWFETHATSVDNEDGVASGQSDPALSRAGRRQAIEMRERHARRRIAVVCSSDLRRAVETAQLAFGGRGLPFVRDARLRECDYGRLTRTRALELERDRLRYVRQPFPEGESYEQVCARVAAFLGELPALAGVGRTAIVIGHRATFFSLEHLLSGRPLEEVVGAAWRWQPGWRYTLTKRNVARLRASGD
jgi:alpha-ribazole phosphatase/probable phosphoglycerate mutase